MNQLEFEFIPKIGEKATIAEIPMNHYFCDYYHIWKKVRSGDVMASLSPESPVMQCVRAITYKEKHGHEDDWKPGQITIDYFKAKFNYIGDESIWNKVMDKM